MSYHILHQFDEQWLADLKQETADNKLKERGLLNSFADDHRQHERRVKVATRESKRWAVVAMALLLATFALLFSIDATRRAESLQQRLDALETAAKK
jgi:Lon protease-like protein